MRQVEDLVARRALAPGPAHPLLREQDAGVRLAGRRQAVKCLWHSGFSAPSLHLRLLVTDRFPMTASFHPDIAVPELALPADAVPWAQAEQPLWTK